MFGWRGQKRGFACQAWRVEPALRLPLAPARALTGNAPHPLRLGVSVVLSPYRNVIISWSSIWFDTLITRLAAWKPVLDVISPINSRDRSTLDNSNAPP